MCAKILLNSALRSRRNLRCIASSEDAPRRATSAGGVCVQFRASVSASQASRKSPCQSPLKTTPPGPVRILLIPTHFARRLGVELVDTSSLRASVEAEIWDQRSWTRAHKTVQSSITLEYFPIEDQRHEKIVPWILFPNSGSLTGVRSTLSRNMFRPVGKPVTASECRSVTPTASDSVSAYRIRLAGDRGVFFSSHASKSTDCSILPSTCRFSNPPGGRRHLRQH